MKTLRIVAICLVAVFSLQTRALACNECHSKNPKMVKMHQALGYKECFTCHGIGRKKSPDEQKASRAGDKLCVRCHRN